MDLEDDMDLDIILSIRTDAEADRFVDEILADPQFLKHDPPQANGLRQSPDPVMVGGQHPSPMDPRVYDLLQLADSLHDFAERPPRDPEYLRWSLNVELPVITKVRPWSAEPFRERMKLGEMYGQFGGKGKTNYLIEDLTLNHSFQFSKGTPVINPLHGKNFEQGMEGPDGTADPPADGFAHAEIRCFEDPHGFKILKLMNVISVVQSIRSFFGSDASFIVDESIPMTRLILATHLIWKSFLKKFRMEGYDVDTSAVVNWWRVWMELSTTWACYTCDADLMDADEHVFPLDARETGYVFREDAQVQIRLFDAALRETPGVDYVSLPDEHERLKAKVPTFKYDVWTQPGCPIHLDDLWRTHDTQDVIGVPYEGLYSSEATAQRIVAVKALGLSAAVQMAQKRAGDWGQIQHCKLYGQVFVTADKTAMLAAIAMGVKALYVRTWLREQAVEDYEKKDRFRHSFAMYIPGDPQTGGSSANVAAQLVLAAVTVGAAIASSLR